MAVLGSRLSKLHRCRCIWLDAHQTAARSNSGRSRPSIPPCGPRLDSLGAPLAQERTQRAVAVGTRGIAARAQADAAGVGIVAQGADDDITAVDDAAVDRQIGQE